jgi:hypothetical protein
MDKNLPKEVLEAYETYRELTKDAALASQAAKAAQDNAIKAGEYFQKLERDYYKGDV